MESMPYKFYFLSESSFKNLKDSLSKGTSEIKISTIGLLSEHYPHKSECLINFEKESLKINFARIETNFLFNSNNYFYVYGILKVILFLILFFYYLFLKLEEGEVVLSLNFYRDLTDTIDLEEFKEIIKTKYFYF